MNCHLIDYFITVLELSKVKASLLYQAQCYLGEGPLWHTERNSFFWVDIEGKRFFEYNFKNQTVQCRKLDYRVSCIVQDSDDNLVLGLEGGIAKYNLETETLTWLIDVEKEYKKHRCNDGKVDSMGRLWMGTLHMDFDEGAGSLYCLQKDLTLQKKIGELTISNGMAWSADNSRLYFIDSPERKVQSFLFDETTGHLDFEKDVIHIPETLGTPDGMTIDEEGMLWIAHWGGFGVYRWNPQNGELMNKIEIPVPNVSSCAFGGEDFNYLFITTARQDLSDQELKNYPDSGDVFWIKLSVKGKPANKFIF